MTLRSKAVCVLALVGSGLFGACSLNASVWIESGSTSTNLVFGLGTRRYWGSALGLIHFSVKGCHDSMASDTSAVWRLEPIPESQYSQSRVRRVKYGQPPTGFQSRVGPKTLIPGCYNVVLDAQGGHYGGVQFTVDSSGMIEEH